MFTKTMFSIAAAFFVCCRPYSRTPTTSPDFTLLIRIFADRVARIGNAHWRAANGEIVADPQGQDGGWLALAEKTPDGGWKGVHVPLDGEPGPYDLTLNAQGKELNRTRVPRATAQFARMAGGPWANGQAHVPGFAAPAVTLAEQAEEAPKPPAPAGPAGRAAPGGRGGFTGPRAEIKVADRNSLGASVDTDMVWTVVHGRPGGNAAPGDRGEWQGICAAGGDRRQSSPGRRAVRAGRRESVGDFEEFIAFALSREKK